MYVEVEKIISEKEKQVNYIINMIKQLLADGKIKTTDELTKTFYTMRYPHRIEEGNLYKYEEPKQISSKPEPQVSSNTKLQNFFERLIEACRLEEDNTKNTRYEIKDRRLADIKWDEKDFYKHVRALTNLWMNYTHKTLNAINTSQNYRLLYIQTLKTIREDLNYYNMAYEKDLKLLKLIFSPIIIPGQEEKKQGNIKRLKRIALSNILP
ncbi:MAG: hypothetical protein PHS45_01510 [Bacilli bacterium]|nr:hypothetical protein [Bacilli bacterium]